MRLARVMTAAELRIPRAEYVAPHFAAPGYAAVVAPAEAEIDAEIPAHGPRVLTKL